MTENLLNILEYCKERGYPVRYIEYMENKHATDVAKGLNSDEIKEIIGQKYKFKKLERSGSSPSQDYQTEDGYIFGIIEPHKDDFCATCNRIRLTASGVLIPCFIF